MSDEKNPFDYMDFTLDEALAADELLRSKPSERDGRICLCGHPVGRHTIATGITYCKPSRMECPCKSCRPVIESDDVRPFLRKTGGAGRQHALGRGMAAAMEKGIHFEWTIDMECDRCHEQGRLSPVPVTQNGTATQEATGFDALLCTSCREQV